MDFTQTSPIDGMKRKIRDMGDGTFAEVIAADMLSTVRLPDGTSVTEITSTQKKWVSEFGGVSLSPEKWDVQTDVGGMTYAVAGGSLTITMGVNPNAELAILSKDIFTVPFDMFFVARLSARVANQEIFLDFVEVDATGVPVPNEFKPGDNNNRAGFLFDGVTSTTSKAEVVSSGSPIAKTVSVTSGQSTASDADWCIEARPEDVWFLAAASDASAARVDRGARISSSVPSPNKIYKARIRCRNLATAPLSSAQLIISRVLVMDIQELQAQIVGGRGDSVGGKSVPVFIAGGTSVTTQSTVTLYADTSAVLGASASFTGTARDMGSTPVTRKVNAVVDSDQPITMWAEFSDDGTTFWRGTADVVGVANPNVPTVLEFAPVTRYWRLRALNTVATATTRFRMRSAAYKV